MSFCRLLHLVGDSVLLQIQVAVGAACVKPVQIGCIVFRQGFPFFRCNFLASMFTMLGSCWHSSKESSWLKATMAM